MDAEEELAFLRAELRALLNDASYAKGIKVIRAAKIAALLDDAPDREQIMTQVRDLEREHFRDPCHPLRCGHVKES